MRRVMHSPLGVIAKRVGERIAKSDMDLGGLALCGGFLLLLLLLYRKRLSITHLTVNL